MIFATAVCSTTYILAETEVYRVPKFLCPSEIAARTTLERPHVSII